jgi:hypothetical protein
MDFFKDDNGRLHGARIAGVIYILAVVHGLVEDWVNPMWAVRIITTAGWCLAFCDKRPPRSSELLTGGRHVVGLVMLVAGIALQFYLLPNK